MLDENFPTFRSRPSPDNPLSSILFFTQNGADPSPEYILRRVDPALPSSRNKYAAALCGPLNADVVYAEVLVTPEWSQPSISGAEMRAQALNGAPPAPATALAPETFAIQLYNPDSTVAIKMVPGTWNKTDSWEFELPVQTFKQPSGSELDRENGGLPPPDLMPRVMFRWKKDSKLSKDMTCYMCGTSLGGRKNKEPDITIAMFKTTTRRDGESVITVYQPNLHRVEVEDRKGLELILLLGAEVIKDLYLSPKADVFNVGGGGSPVGVAGRRKNSKPTSTPPGMPIMSGAVATNGGPAGAGGQFVATNAIRHPDTIPVTASSATNLSSSKANIDAETQRLKAMVEHEEQERQKRQRQEREKREQEEQQRIKRMLEEEEQRERQRREAEVAAETERLRREYGMEGQELPSIVHSPLALQNGGTFSSPTLPPRQTFQNTPPPPHLFQQPSQGQLLPTTNWGATPSLPPRPLSVGPPGTHHVSGSSSTSRPGPFHCDKLNKVWNGVVVPALDRGSGTPGPGSSGRRRSSGAPYLSADQSNGNGRYGYSQGSAGLTGGNGSLGASDRERERDRERNRKIAKKKSALW
ncbi:hypothetical protein QR685DRAFT_515798 [Neurospora intermedia]|uniref:Uncharacterized protein n=1 Tax=Neurospora intermedia TaxID=5142 RepID=A0ABR3DK82_NEUIN